MSTRVLCPLLIKSVVTIPRLNMLLVQRHFQAECEFLALLIDEDGGQLIAKDGGLAGVGDDTIQIILN